MGGIAKSRTKNVIYQDIVPNLCTEFQKLREHHRAIKTTGTDAPSFIYADDLADLLTEKKVFPAKMTQRNKLNFISRAIRMHDGFEDVVKEQLSEVNNGVTRNRVIYRIKTRAEMAAEMKKKTEGSSLLDELQELANRYANDPNVHRLLELIQAWG